MPMPVPIAAPMAELLVFSPSSTRCSGSASLLALEDLFYLDFRSLSGIDAPIAEPTAAPTPNPTPRPTAFPIF